MKVPPLSRQQVRQVDQIAIEVYGMSGLVLMENAGRGAAERIFHLATGIDAEEEILILCGRGNNAGDGYVIARHLELMGRQPRVVSLEPLDRLSGDALHNARLCEKANLPIDILSDPNEVAVRVASAPVIVECLLGTGATGAPRGIYADAVKAANRSEALRIAIDIPAGLDCDTGHANSPTFLAAETITFVASKTGFARADGPSHVGNVHDVGIGVPKKLLLEITSEISQSSGVASD